MKRREYLTLATGATLSLAGCVSGDGDDGDMEAGGTDPEADDDDAGTPEDDGRNEDEQYQGTWSTDSPPTYGVGPTYSTAAGPLEHDIRIDRATPTEDGPVTITTTVHNPTGETVTYGDRRAVQGKYLRESGFVLVPAGGYDPDFDEERGHWLLDNPVVTTADYQVEDLPPGETHEQELQLVVDQPANLVESATTHQFGMEYAASPVAELDPEPTHDWHFSLVACPPYPPIRDRVVCSTTADSAGTAEPVMLTPTPASRPVEDGRPAEELTLSLVNDSSTDLTFNPHSWRVRRYADTVWEPIDGTLVGDGKLTVTAGETHEWTVTDVMNWIAPDVDLEPGLYAAEIGVPDPKNSSDWLACVAIFQLY